MHKVNQYLLVFIIAVSTIIPSLTRASDPEHVALVDTGYDLCLASGGNQCLNNKNLLFRGAAPLPDDPPYDFNFDNFRENILTYLNYFNQTFATSAQLPKSIAELEQYRIVVINLLYDYNQNGSNYELNELQNEFKDSGQTASLQIPEQHKIYGLDTPFNSNTYAFEWWPITFAELADNDPQFLTMHINWPDTMGTPAHTFEPKEYKLLDLPYFITSTPYEGDNEQNAADLRTLLLSIPRDGHPLLIFYHCVAGKDRTGAVSMAYMMKQGGYPYFSTVQNIYPQYRKSPVSFAEALEYTTLPNRIPNHGAQKLARAYCLALGKAPEACR